MEENTQPDNNPEHPNQPTPPQHNNQPIVGNVGPNPQPPSLAPPPPPPQFQPQPPAPSYNQPYALTNAAPEHPPTSSGQIVLQWLTYAFWGWTVLAMSILTATVLANFINDADTGGFTPYGIAAVLVLLPIAIVCDVFYSKQEPVKKTGAASVVMIIHAVLFALFGIGALIGIVISLVTMFTSSGDSSSTQVALFSTMIITVLYAAVFLRTINPTRTPWIRRFFPIFMAVIVGIISILGFVGPVANARLTRNDRLISDNISQVQQGISSYSNDNAKLPEDLKSLTLTGDAKQLVDDDLLTYKPNSKSPSTESNYSSYYGSSSSSSTAAKSSKKTYYYQLCATYKKASDRYGNSYSASSRSNSEYQSYISAYSHPAGEVCYNLKTSAY